MNEITSYKEMEGLCSLYAKSKLSPLFVGMGGIGKTEGLMAYAKKVAHKPLIVINAAQYTTAASLTGMRQTQDSFGNIIWDIKVPDWYPCYRINPITGEEVETSEETKGFEPIYDKQNRVKNHDAVILLDEVNRMEISLQNYFLTIILSKSIANQKMSDGVEFVGACNPHEGAYRKFTKDLDPSFADSPMARFQSFEFKPTEKSWAEFMGEEENIHRSVKRFLLAKCGKTFHPFDFEQTSGRTAYEAFKMIGELKNLGNPIVEKMALTQLGEKNLASIKAYIAETSHWDGEAILNGKQKVENWFDLAEASDSIIFYLHSQKGVLTPTEKKVFSLLVNFKWRGANETLISIKEVVRFFNEIYNESEIDSLEIKNIIMGLDAKAIAGKAKVLG